MFRTIHGLGGTGKSQLALGYTENDKDQFNPIWIDATNDQDVRSSFKQCIIELGLPEKPVEANGRLSTDLTVQTSLQWFSNRTEADEERLVTVDNADSCYPVGDPCYLAGFIRLLTITLCLALIQYV